MTYKDNIIRSMQTYEKGLEDNCRRWADLLARLIKAGDRMAEVSKNRGYRQAWWDAKGKK